MSEETKEVVRQFVRHTTPLSDEELADYIMEVQLEELRLQELEEEG
tara:strand:- start:951 stop:1088 length:138 start_codon:yes stop_codon:yes gene_type:complete